MTSTCPAVLSHLCAAFWCCVWIPQSHSPFAAVIIQTRPSLWMSLPSLPIVLAQSIAHFLRTKERIVLARCGQHSLAWVQSPFAWLCADPILLECDPPASPLLRCIPVSLRFDAESNPNHAVSCILSLATRTAVVELWLLQWSMLTDEQAERLLRSPAMQRITSLHILSPTERLVDLACTQLLKLQKLELRSQCWIEICGSLPLAPCLTDLSVCDTSSLSCLPAVSQCVHLRRLRVHSYCGAEFLGLCRAPCMRHMEDLALMGFDARSGPAGFETLYAGFACLRSLHTIRLQARELGVVVAFLYRIPRLRCLVIVLESDDGLCCSWQGLMDLLHLVPQLSVVWHACHSLAPIQAQIDRIVSMDAEMAPRLSCTFSGAANAH